MRERSVPVATPRGYVMKVGRRAIGTAVVLIVLAVTAMVFVAQASSKSMRTTSLSYVNNSHGSSVPVLSCAKPSCTVWYRLSNGFKVQMVCWTDTVWFNGNYNSPRWFWVAWGTSSGSIRSGFVHSSYVYNQTKVGHCSTWPQYRLVCSKALRFPRETQGCFILMGSIPFPDY